MTRKSTLGLGKAGLLAVLLLGLSPLINLEEKVMATAGTTSAVTKTIPPLDQRVPAVTETATFALG